MEDLQLEEVLDSITDAFLTLDRERRITYVNRRAEELMRRSRDMLLGKDILEEFPELKNSPAHKAFIKVAREGKAVEFEQVYPKPRALLEVRVYPTRSGVAIYYRDVTKRRRVEEEARQAMERRDTLLAMARHDLRNALMLIKGGAQLLQEQVQSGAADAKRMIDGLARIDRAAGRMTALIDNQIDQAQLEAGHDLALDRCHTDLVSLVRGATETHQFSTDAHRIVFSTDIERACGEWDEGRLERVLGNLLSNAIKFSPRGAEVTVGLTIEPDPEGPWAVLTVKDLGMGIPARDLPHVFDSFSRGQNVIGVVPGSGIGLSVAKHIIEAHGGTIAVSSIEGQGTIFTVRLPLSEAPSVSSAS